MSALSAGQGFVGIIFCQECNNMLYPREDKHNRVLLYACRSVDRVMVTREDGRLCPVFVFLEILLKIDI